MGLSIVGLAGLLASCGGNTSSTTPAASTPAASTPAASTPAPVKETYKVGLGNYIDFATDADTGLVTQVNVYVAAVVVDSKDVVVSTYMDEVQMPITFDATNTEAPYSFTAGNKAVKDAGDKIVESKKELGDRYAMHSIMNNPMGEWWEQAEAFEAWTVGKTATEIAAVVGENDKPVAGSDLASDVSITVDTSCDTVVKAIASAQEVEADVAPVAGASLIVSNIENSHGNWVIEVNMAGTAIVGDKIGGTNIDVYQVALGSDGKCATTAVQYTEAEAKGLIMCSKRDLGDKYGMSTAPLGDWYEQAAAYEAWAKGKTVAEVEAAVGEDNKPTSGSDLATDVSITVDGFVAAIKESMNPVVNSAK